MHFKKNAVFRNTGFMIKRVQHGWADAPLFEFEDLNPQQKFRQSIGRLEAFRIGLWFIRQAISK